MAAETEAPRVLVIDDDAVALQAATELLQRAGFHVFPMPSPIGATQAIVRNNIRAAVVDLNMPVMQGDRFVHLVRKWDRIRDLPIIMLSGAPAETLEHISQEIPGVRVVSKDTMETELAKAVHSSLKSGRSA